jgi:hypothetical protein
VFRDEDASIGPSMREADGPCARWVDLPPHRIKC